MITNNVKLCDSLPQNSIAQCMLKLLGSLEYPPVGFSSTTHVFHVSLLAREHADGILLDGKPLWLSPHQSPLPCLWSMGK